MGAQHYPEAEKMLQKSLALEPSYPAYANLGSLYIEERKYTEAANAEEKTLELNDKNYLVWGNLANPYEVLKESGKEGRARDREITLHKHAAKANKHNAGMKSDVRRLPPHKNVT